MTFDEYQKAAIRTINPKLSPAERHDMLALGLLGESGEIAEAIKKGRYHSHPIDNVKLAKEVGDVMWYVACLAETMGVTLSKMIKATFDHWRETGETWVGWDESNPNSVGSFQSNVEAHIMAPMDERGEKMEQFSEITHAVCTACHGLATATMFRRDERNSAPLSDEEIASFGSDFTYVLVECARYAVLLDHSLETILIENEAKLRARYPEGFSAERSLNRKE